MTPTQLTVLTKASTSAPRMLPVLLSIIHPASLRESTVPPLHDAYGPSMLCDLNDLKDSLAECLCPYPDSGNEPPRKRLLDQELRLLRFRAMQPLASLDCPPIDSGQFLQVAMILEIQGTGVGSREFPPPPVPISKLGGCSKVCFQMYDVVLPCTACKFRVIPLADYIFHYRSRTTDYRGKAVDLNEMVDTRRGGLWHCDPSYIRF